MTFLMSKKFKQLVRGPTHKLGRCLDHVYVLRADNFTTTVEGCYYSDHDKLITVWRDGDGGGNVLASQSRAVRRSGRNTKGEVDGLVSQSQVEDQDNCKALRQSGRNDDGEGYVLASQLKVQDQEGCEAVRGWWRRTGQPFMCTGPR